MHSTLQRLNLAIGRKDIQKEIKNNTLREMCVRADLGSAGLWYCALLYFYVAWLKSALWMCSPRGAALAFIADWMWNRSRVCLDTVYSSFAGTHLTYSYWQQSGWGHASLLTVVTTPSVGVWWNYTLRENPSSVLVIGLCNGEIASAVRQRHYMLSYV